MDSMKLPTYEYRPKLPSLEELERKPLLFLYDDVADELVVAFSDPPRPAVSVFLDDPDWLALRVEPDTGEVVAVQIVDYLSRAIHEMPELLDLAELAGVPREVVEQTRREVPREERERAAVRTLVRVMTPA